MPLPLYHLGPGVALHAAAPRHVSFLAFSAGYGLIDFESLFNMLSGRHPVHGFLHTFVGATIVLAAIVLLFVVARWFAARFWLPDLFGWRGLTTSQVALGAALGAYSHIVLDGIMHSDMRPLAPFSDANALLGVIAIEDLLFVCTALGVAGVIGLGVRKAYEMGSRLERRGHREK